MSTQEKPYKILNKEELENSVMELEVEVPYSALESHRDEAVKSASKDLEVPGFRKGTAPEKIVIEKIGEMAILEQAAYKVLDTIVPIVITSEKINALTQPEISITKIAPNSALVFKLKITLLPNIKLSDYKKIAQDVKKADNAEVTEKEMDDYIDFIRKQKAGAVASVALEEGEEKKEPELPEFDEEFVKTLGDFKSVDEFKKQLRENMTKEKKNKEVQRRRLEIVEEIIKESKIDVPVILVDQELDRMMGQFRHDIEKVGMKFDDYLKEIKKTDEDLKNEWKVDATKRAKMNLILPKIAMEEKLNVDEKKIDEEVAHLMSHHKDIEKNHAKLYVRNIMMNEEVFKFLENSK
ncbi:MAG: FKBP-type peptidyl-prolyl cis-trans isomerase (trigger factor) [Candidatus Paceibacteria bacterium]|jgi:FKBP-type peptidyl-prolyl cis-trans isomerase (trigger factor)